MPRSFLSLRDLSGEDLSEVLSIAADVDDLCLGRRALRGKTVGIYFAKPSTRTRTAFTLASMRLGADVMTYGADELQLSTGESWKHTGKVLGELLDMFVIRTNDDLSQMRDASCELSTINAMSREEHPSQAVTDFITINEAFGRLYDLHILYVGEGNNTALALASGVGRLRGIQLTLLCPDGYGLAREELASVSKLAAANGSTVSMVNTLSEVSGPVDVVYTSRWETMGVPHLESDWRTHFQGFRIDREFLSRIQTKEGRVPMIMHDLPARPGEEITAEMLVCPTSIVWRQAYHKFTGACSILTWLGRS